jgi:DNA-binding SARP family transcriptional activator
MDGMHGKLLPICCRKLPFAFLFASVQVRRYDVGAGTGLRFAILGALAASRDGVALDLGPAKQLAVLGVLLLNANRPVPTSQIVDAVWGEEPPENGANAVQKYVAGLRRVLEPDGDARSPTHPLTRTPAGYLLSVEPGCLDVEEFRERLRGAEAARLAGQLAAAAAMVRTALDLWRADPFAGLPGPVFDGARRQLADAHAEAWETWAEVELAAGRQHSLVPELLRLVADHPLRERLRAQLMLALYRSGRQAEALAAFQEARAFLVDRFGVEPGERLRAVHAEILRDPPGPLPPPLPTPPPPLPAPPLPAPPQPALTGAAGDRGHALEVPPQRPTAGRLAAWCVPVALTVLSVGLATFLVVGWHAVRRRSWSLAGYAAGYLALIVIFLTTANGPVSWLAGIAALVNLVGGGVHAALLGPVPAWKQRIRREQALLLLRHDPAMAHDLRIGRPDLPRAYDDGGLVDINSAPERTIAALPGITPEQAHQIVAYRQARGCFARVGELAEIGLLPRRLRYGARATLIAIPPLPAPVIA